MRRFLLVLMFLSGASMAAPLIGPAYALDPPHNAGASICTSACHVLHHALGSTVTQVQGNANLCQSCHVSGGQATNKPLPNANEALPNPGLPSTQTAAGSSHRWDSGISGHVSPDAANTSGGKVESAGDFTGPYAKTYTITISTAGDVGVARFNWTTNSPAPPSPVTNNVLDQFNSQLYSNNDGSANWAGNWIDPEDSSPTAGKVQVTAGGELRLNGPPPTPGTSPTALDQFTTAAFNNSNGTYSWTAQPWVETDPGGAGVSAGNIRVRGADTACNDGVGNCFRMQPTTLNDNLYRPVTLTGATSATLTYNYKRTVAATPGTIRLDIYNGTTWTNGVRTYSTAATGSESIDITSYISADTRIRFYTSVATATTGFYLYVDNVQIGWTTPGSGTEASAAREANLSGATTATFSFNYRTGSGVVASDALVVEASSNGGGSYTALETITGIAGASSGTKSYNILSYAAANTRVRFRVSNGYSAANAYFYADNVQIQYVAPGSSGGTNVLTAGSVTLDEGITAAFTNGPLAPSFKLNDKWYVYVRTDINQPTDPEMLKRISAQGKFACSTCHNEHSQALQPFDPSAPAYVGGGAGRHFQRLANDTDQLCKQCHSARNISPSVTGKAITGAANNGSGLIRITATAHGFATGDSIRIAGVGGTTEANDTWVITMITVNTFDLRRSRFVNAYTSGGTATKLTSHLVGLPVVPAAGKYQSPTTLPLDTAASQVQCSTCHKLHYSPATDGTLARFSNTNSLCTECHTLADTAAGSHFNASTGALWPGGQYGSLFSQVTDASKKGYCTNCHQPHGWPDAADTTKKYPSLLVDRGESFCYTCHDGSPVSKNIMALFGKTTRHPVNDAEQPTGRTVECTDCHNVHKAKAGAHAAQTNVAGPPLEGVLGAKLNAGLTYWQALTAANFTAPTITAGTDLEATLCFKCHSNYSFPTYNTGTATFSASTTVTGSGTSWTASLVGGTILRSGDTRTYLVTAVASGTSMTITPTYAGTAGSGAYTIWNPPAGLSAVYNTGTATFTNASATVTGSGTTWTAGMVGAMIRRTGDTTAYRITAFASATSITISPVYGGTTGSGATYVISLQTDTAREFNPANVGNFAGTWANGETAGSFHPVLASASSNLGATSNIIAPWTRTSLMTCTDCHASDTTTDPNGPHGSAAGFLLKGPNTLWNSSLINGSSMPAGTFCRNCHNANYTSSRYPDHTRSDHFVACFNCHSAIPHGTMRPGLLSAQAGANANVGGTLATDLAPYGQAPTTSNRLYLVSYPTNNTNSWQQSNCGCNGTGH